MKEPSSQGRGPTRAHSASLAANDGKRSVEKAATSPREPGRAPGALPMDYEPCQLLRPREVARILSISVSKVYAMLARDEIPGKRVIAGSIRVIDTELYAWIHSIAGAA